MPKKPKEPVPVYYLRERIKYWGISGDAIVIRPLDASFDELHIRKIPIEWGFGEFKWKFTGFLNIVSPDEMDDQSIELYRKLKGMETDLTWRGTLSKKPVFEVSPVLEDLATLVKNLKPNRELAET